MHTFFGLLGIVSCTAVQRDTTPAGENAPQLAETAKVITEDAMPVDPGATEVEVGYSIGGTDRTYDAGNNLVDRATLLGQVFNLGATHGLVDGLDLAVGVGLRDVIKDESKELSDGLGNVFANAKWRFFQSESGGLAMAWLPGFTAPFGPSESTVKISPGQDFWSIDNLLVLTIVRERFNLSLDFGYSLPVGSDRDEQIGTTVGDAAVGYQLFGWLQPMVEFNYSHGLVEARNGSDFFALTPGLILNPAGFLRVDIGVQQAVYGRNNDFGTVVLTNFSVTF